MADEANYAGVGTRAQIAASTTINAQEITREIDRGRAAFGNINAGTGVILAGKWALAAIDLEAAGNTTLGMKSQYPFHDLVITATDGPYTHNVIIPQEVTGVDGLTPVEFALGDVLEVRLELPSTADLITVHFYHDAVAGAALASPATEDGVARNYILQFRHDGTQWQVWDVRQVNS